MPIEQVQGWEFIKERCQEKKKENTLSSKKKVRFNEKKKEIRFRPRKKEKTRS